MPHYLDRGEALRGEELSQADESALYHHYEPHHTARQLKRPPTRPSLEVGA